MGRNDPNWLTDLHENAKSDPQAAEVLADFYEGETNRPDIAEMWRTTAQGLRRGSPGTSIKARFDYDELPHKTDLHWRALTRTGYGNKIPTDAWVKLPGSLRCRRVYVAISGNSGTSYVQQGKSWIVITGRPRDFVGPQPQAKRRQYRGRRLY